MKREIPARTEVSCDFCKKVCARTDRRQNGVLALKRQNGIRE